MMSYTDQLVQSRTRLQKQGGLFFQQSQKAGEALVAETRDASVAFAEGLRDAGAAWTEAMTESVHALGRALLEEATDWRELSIKTRDAYVEALTKRFDVLEKRAEEAQQALQPASLQSKVLQATHEVLGDAQKRVEAKLEEAAAAPAKKSTEAPIRNYDQLTAKDVVARIQRLSGPQATAVLAYEKARKNRVTVLKAAKQRLATG